MDSLALRTATSYNVLPLLRKIRPENWDFKTITMKYHVTYLPNYDDPETYPVSIIFHDTLDNKDYEIKIAALSVGYSGTGPHDFMDVLDYLGVTYEKEDIITKRKADENGYIQLEYVAN